ncbi:hypothetical protein NC653_023202 [Populus alba x Populus x berolinensis]|uniref:Uncharacterized protein n=1 Tax=Populus alba x Populus x berolinensis TaxID=444605 RepID=A0AAD6MGJ5_9ROSI|nr:hypothetical protein NC653_023202 [Populus alba x Populus x berolinensis]
MPKSQNKKKKEKKHCHQIFMQLWVRVQHSIRI